MWDTCFDLWLNVSKFDLVVVHRRREKWPSWMIKSKNYIWKMRLRSSMIETFLPNSPKWSKIDLLCLIVFNINRLNISVWYSATVLYLLKYLVQNDEVQFLHLVSQLKAARRPCPYKLFQGKWRTGCVGFRACWIQFFAFLNLRALVVSLGGQLKSVFPCFLDEEFNPLNTFIFGEWSLFRLYLKEL